MKTSHKNQSGSFFHIFLIAFIFLICLSSFIHSFKEYVLRNEPVSGAVSTLASVIPVKVAEIEGVDSVYYRDVRAFAKENNDLDYESALTLAVTRETLSGFSKELEDFRLNNFFDDDSNVSELANIWLSIKSSEKPDSYDYDPRFQEIQTLQYFINDIGIDFSSIARQYSELDSSYLGGYLGEINKDDLPDPVLYDFFDSENKYSEILVGRDYFYLAMKGFEGNEGVDFYLIGIRRADMEEYIRSYAGVHRVIMY